MGDRVLAFTADMSREQHARAIASFEAAAEAHLEDLEKGAAYDVHVTAKARGEGGRIPRGVSLYKDAPTVIAGLIGEIRRRDALLARAVDAIEGHGSYESCASCASVLAEVRAMLCPVPVREAPSVLDEFAQFASEVETDVEVSPPLQAAELPAEQPAEPPLVRVTAYRGCLVIDGPLEIEHPDWRPANEQRFGCVIVNTAQHLGVSEDAMVLLRELRPGRDSLGDLDWRRLNDGKHVFGWIGGPRKIVLLDRATTSRHWVVGPYRSIPNDVAAEARAVIAQELGEVAELEGGQP